MSLNDKILALLFVPSQKKTKLTRALFLGLTVLLTLNQAFPGVLADSDKRLTQVVSMVLGIIYVIMVFVGIFLIVTNVMSFATADADNGPARTKATYGMAGGGLLVILPAVLTLFPFANWVAEQIKDLSGLGRG